MQLIMLPILFVIYLFQSSPAPRSGCNKDRCDSVTAVINVSILTRSAGFAEAKADVSILTRSEERVQLYLLALVPTS